MVRNSLQISVSCKDLNLLITELIACIAPLMSWVSVASKMGGTRAFMEVWQESIRTYILSEK